VKWNYSYHKGKVFVVKNNLLTNFLSLKNSSDLEELKEYKTINSKTYKNNKNSKLRTVLFTRPVHYYKNSELVEEVHELTSTSYGWKMIQTNLETRLPSKSDGQMWVGTLNQHIKFQAINTNLSIGHQKDYDDLNLSPTKFQFPFVHYKDAWFDADLIYYPTGITASKYIIIKSKNSPKEYVFDIILENLHIDKYTNKESSTWFDETDKNKSIDILNKENKKFGDLFYPFAIDSMGVRTQVGREIQKISENTYRIKISINDDFFQHAVFPIQLDPFFNTSGYVSTSGFGSWKVENPSQGHGSASQWPTISSHPESDYSTGGGIDSGVWNQATHPNGCRHEVRRGFITWYTGTLRNHLNFSITSATLYLHLISYTKTGECHEHPDYQDWPIYVYSIAERNDLSTTAFEANADIDAAAIDTDDEQDEWTTIPWTISTRRALITDDQQYIAIKIFQAWDREGFSLWETSGGPHGGSYSNCVNLFSYGTDSYIIIEWVATPEAPTNLSVSDTHQNSLLLNWTNNSTMNTYFKIDRKIGSGSWTINYATSTLNATSYTDTNTYQDTTYTYRVRAYCTELTNEADRYSSYSNEAYGSYSILAPTNFHATDQGNKIVYLSWTNNEPYFDTIEMQRNVNGAGWTSLINLDDLITNYTNSNVPENVDILYRIRSKRSPNNPSYSAWVLAPEIINCHLNIPLLTLINITRYKNELSWESIITPYQSISIERKIDNGEWEIIETLDYTYLNFYDRDVYPRDNKYSYRCRIYNNYFDNPWSDYGYSDPQSLWLSTEMRARKYFYNPIL
jgi:hypothetical protein